MRWAADFLCRVDKSAGLDVSPLLPPVMECLEHRVAEVRAGAERCLAAVIACGGLDAVNRCLRDLKPAQLKALRPVCDKAEKAAAAMSAAGGAAAASAPRPEGAVSGEPAAEKAAASKAVAATREHGVEKENSMASVGRKDGAAAAGSAAPAGSRKVAEPAAELEVEVGGGGDGAVKVLRCNGGKEAREKQHGKVKWLLDDAREAEALLEALDRQMAPVSSEEVHAKLFSRDFKKQAEGIRDLVAFVPQNPKVRALSAPLAPGKLLLPLSFCSLSFSLSPRLLLSCSFLACCLSTMRRPPGSAQLIPVAASLPQELTDNLDLVLKMCTLRMTGKAANTTLVLAVLELLRAVFEVRALRSPACARCTPLASMFGQKRAFPTPLIACA